jgi:hypothetical protein
MLSGLESGATALERPWYESLFGSLVLKVLRVGLGVSLSFTNLNILIQSGYSALPTVKSMFIIMIGSWCSKCRK